MKFGDCFSNLFEIKGTKFYSDLFRFNISIARCLGVYFFPDTVYLILVSWIQICTKSCNNN